MGRMTYGVESGEQRRKEQEAQREMEQFREVTPDEEQARMLKESFEEAKRQHQGGRRRSYTR